MKLAALVLVLSLFFFAPAAFAKNTSSTVFPPAGCSETEKMILSWQKDGSSTECLTATQVVDLAVPNCKAGQLLVKSATGYSCMQLPTCNSGQALVFDGKQFICAVIEGSLKKPPQCTPPQALTFNGGEFQCSRVGILGYSCPEGQYMSGIAYDGSLLCSTPSGGSTPTPVPTPVNITTYPGGCVNSFCSGFANAIFPVANTTLGKSNRMPAVCDGTWWIQTNSELIMGETVQYFNSSCSTGWRWLANCYRPDGFWQSPNGKDYYDGCPDPNGEAWW